MCAPLHSDRLLWGLWERHHVRLCAMLCCVYNSAHQYRRLLRPRCGNSCALQHRHVDTPGEWAQSQYTAPGPGGSDQSHDQRTPSGLQQHLLGDQGGNSDYRWDWRSNYHFNEGTFIASVRFTFAGEVQLSADHGCIICVPLIVTHCSPHIVEADLHPPLIGWCATN